MKTIRNIAAVSLLAAGFAPLSAMADWDEVRIARDHPQILDQSLLSGAAAGDASRTSITDAYKGVDKNTERLWSLQAKQREVAP